MGDAPIPSSNALPPPFLSKTYDMVDDPSTDAIVSWSSSNNSFVIWNPPEFGDLLPKYFKHSNFSSFVRQLNTYGFRKIDPDRWEFANEGFLRGQKQLLKTISRRKAPHVHNQLHTRQSQNSNSACVELGKFGLEEEVEMLKRDKNVLVQELVRLRQQQQGTDNQLQTMAQRLQGMEQRQQQMMSFLAKAVQSPGFFAQFVQQQSESKLITGGNKKRRIKPQHISNNGSSSQDGQIVKYQSYGSDKTKAIFRQLWDINESLQSVPFNDKLDSFPAVGVPSSNMPGKGDSSSPTSGAVYHNSVTFSENPATTNASGCQTFAGDLEDQASSVGNASTATPNQNAQNPDALIGTHESTSHPQSDLLMDELPIYRDMPPVNIVDAINDELLLGPTSFEADVPFSLDIDGVPVESDIDSFFNDDEELWDMLNVKSEGMNAKTNGVTTTLTSSHPAGAGRMDLLTEQMGLLSPDPKKIG